MANEQFRQELLEQMTTQAQSRFAGRVAVTLRYTIGMASVSVARARKAMIICECAPLTPFINQKTDSRLARAARTRFISSGVSAPSLRSSFTVEMVCTCCR
jgi:hypothetical protein